MKKTLLAVAITAISAQASALEIYNNDGTVMKIGGHATIGLTGAHAGEDARVEEKSPRINLEVIQDLGNGFKADFKGEWQVNLLKGGDNSFKTRLGYIGVGHETYGRLAAGTQWSPYYMAASVVDQPIGWSNEFLYDNQGIFGTARGEKLLAYTNTIDLENRGKITLGAGWQGAASTTKTEQSVVAGEVKTDTVTVLESENRVQFAAGYEVNGFALNYAINSGDVKEYGVNKKAESNLVSGKYGTFGQGLYVAATYAMNENMNKHNGHLVAETKAVDSIFAYGFDNGLNLILKHEEMKDDKQDLRMKSGTSVQAEYSISPRLRAYTGYNYDNQGEGMYKKDKDHQFIIGTRFYL
ncbi:porin [Vibrio barjaei]|uniref:porin n=1 Tax=Vibrio barjaei TaxID=1676683 RepID=UPI002283F127|nr:porin [Vibrio barjaei]MCY9874501.1 porin [Vibrio barjaei]